MGRTEPNLDDLGLTFQHMNIDIQELVEYVKNVDSVSCPIQIPQFPVRRENHLNFLKPGSREVVTRSVHIHEHLPAMYPDTEGNINYIFHVDAVIKHIITLIIQDTFKILGQASGRIS